MIGDVLASSIICNNLKTIYKDCQVDYLVYPFTKPVVENNPNIDNIILFEDKFKKSKLDFIKFLFKIRKSKYDIVIDAYSKLESKLIIAFSGAKQKIGFEKTSSNFIYTDKVEDISIATRNAGNAIENRLNLLSPLFDTKNLDLRPKIYLTEEEIMSAKHFLNENQIDFSKKIYMISILGSDLKKSYPSEYMANILNFIVEKTNATLLFNYIPNQIEEVKKIFDLCQYKTQNNIKLNVTGKSIREFLAITYHCNAVLGNEGGAINMAKALSIPTFTIFSTWINKISWNSFEDGKNNVSVHLMDFKPDLYQGKMAKEMKNKADELYNEFVPELIYPELSNYLSEN